MKVKLDENLPLRLVLRLRELGHDVDTVKDEGLLGRADEAVWGAAQAAGRFFVTQDLDFADIRKRTPGTHHGLLLVRLRDPGTLALTERLATVFRDESLTTWPGAMVVVTDRKVRVQGGRAA